jgi:hypothetical protein
VQFGCHEVCSASEPATPHNTSVTSSCSRSHTLL